MEKQALETIKKKLEEKKKQLEQELGSFTTKDENIPDNYRSNFPQFGDDEDENASEVAAYSDNLSLEHTLEKQLRDVNKALKQIADGTYGVCKHCGNEIEEGRLMARPVSTSCVSCKKKLKGEG